MFDRSLPSRLVDALIASPFWASVVADPDLCPRIRKNCVTVYYRGCGLIRAIRLQNGHLVARVNRKFVPVRSAASELELLEDNATGGLQFRVPPVALPLGQADRATLAAYKDCVRVRPEMRLVDDIIRHDGNRNAILDQEIEFAESGANADRVDLCWFDAGRGQLVFVEVKRFDDRRLRASDGDGPPEVLAQLQRYRDRLARHREAILAAYRRVVELQRKLGLAGRLAGVPNDGAAGLLERPLLVIGGCDDDTRARVMAGEDRYAPLMNGLRDAAAGVIVCGHSCRLVLQTRSPTSVCYLPGC